MAHPGLVGEPKKKSEGNPKISFDIITAKAAQSRSALAPLDIPDSLQGVDRAGLSSEAPVKNGGLKMKLISRYRINRDSVPKLFAYSQFLQFRPLFSFGKK